MSSDLLNKVEGERRKRDAQQHVVDLKKVGQEIRKENKGVYRNKENKKVLQTFKKKRLISKMAEKAKLHEGAQTEGGDSEDMEIAGIGGVKGAISWNPVIKLQPIGEGAKAKLTLR